MKGKILGEGFYGAVRDLVTVSFACLCVALINGCASSGPSYEIDYDHSFPFSAYRTYRWYDDDHVTRESQYRRYNSSDQRVRNTASQELMQRGFREATAGKADF